MEESNNSWAVLQLSEIRPQAVDWDNMAVWGTGEIRWIQARLSGGAEAVGITASPSPLLDSIFPLTDCRYLANINGYHYFSMTILSCKKLGFCFCTKARQLALRWSLSEELAPDSQRELVKQNSNPGVLHISTSSYDPASQLTSSWNTF